MKRRIEIFTFVLVVLAAAGISMGFQELRSAAAKEASRTFVKNCSLSGCHQGQFPPLGLNLGKDQFQDSLINVPSQEVPSLKLVNTQNPEQGYLLMKIRGSKGIVGKQMPINSPPLEQEEILAIESWVRSLEGLDIKEGAVSSKNKVQKPAFWGTRVVNLPTPRSIGKGKVLFRLSHRFFPAVKEGYDVFYGLDGPASMLLGLGYGFSDNISLTLSRANVSKEFELALKWTLIDQSGTDGPISMALVGITTPQFVPGGEFRISKGEFRIGFNIFRWF